MPAKNEETMHEREIREVVAEVLAEQRKHDYFDEIVVKTIAEILTSFGIEEEDRIELRADFAHLRKWRKSVEQAQTLTFKVIVTALVTGIIGAIWLGFKMMVGKS